MKTVIQRVGGGPVTFEEFADKHGLTLEVKERSGSFVGTAAHWYAKFGGVDLSDGCILIGAYGDGRTPEEAIEDYKRVLAGKRIRIGYPVVKTGEKNIYLETPTEWLPSSKGPQT